MHLLFKIQESGHDEMVRAKEVSFRDPKQRLKQNSSPLYPMLKWENVMAEECINEEHAGEKLFPQDIMV